VFVFEHAFLYPMEGEVDESAGAGEIGRAAVRRTGRDVSLVTYGGSVPKALAAADELAAVGIEAEVVDLRTLRPLDTATVLASVARTHRALIVDEGWRTGSFAAEVSARIMEGGFYDLDAPVQRVCTAEVPIPYAGHLEEAALPQPATIAAAARAMLERHG
jgi:pyruvate dehydrogenase E1 component beta subunit